MIKRTTLACCIIICSILTLQAGCGTEHPLTIGLVPSNEPEEMEKAFQPMTDYLEKELNRPVRVFVPSSYLGLIEAMKQGKVDIGWYGAFSYIAAESEMKLDPLVIQYRKELGMTYHSIIVVRADSTIQDVSDLEGKNYAFVDPGSTSGFVIPYALFKSRGIDYTEWLGEIRYAGTHDAVPVEVLNGTVDAGSMEDLTYKRMIKEGSLREGDLRIIWQSKEIPGSPFIARDDLEEELKNKFKQAMLHVHEKNPEAVEAFDPRILKYVEIDASLYNDIRNTATILGKEFVLEKFLKKE